MNMQIEISFLHINKVSYKQILNQFPGTPLWIKTFPMLFFQNLWKMHVCLHPFSSYQHLQAFQLNIYTPTDKPSSVINPNTITAGIRRWSHMGSPYFWTIHRTISFFLILPICLKLCHLQTPPPLLFLLSRFSGWMFITPHFMCYFA